LVGLSAGGGAIAIHARGKPDGTFHSLTQLSSVDDKPLALDKTLKIFAYNIRDQWSGVWQQRASRESALPREIIELPGAGHFIPDLVREKPDLLQLVLDKLKQ